MIKYRSLENPTTTKTTTIYHSEAGEVITKDDVLK